MIGLQDELIPDAQVQLIGLAAGDHHLVGGRRQATVVEPWALEGGARGAARRALPERLEGFDVGANGPARMLAPSPTTSTPGSTANRSNASGGGCLLVELDVEVGWARLVSHPLHGGRRASCRRSPTSGTTVASG